MWAENDKYTESRDLALNVAYGTLVQNTEPWILSMFSVLRYRSTSIKEQRNFFFENQVFLAEKRRRHT